MLGPREEGGGGAGEGPIPPTRSLSLPAPPRRAARGGAHPPSQGEGGGAQARSEGLGQRGPRRRRTGARSTLPYPAHAWARMAGWLAGWLAGWRRRPPTPCLPAWACPLLQLPASTHPRTHARTHAPRAAARPSPVATRSIRLSRLPSPSAGDAAGRAPLRLGTVGCASSPSSVRRPALVRSAPFFPPFLPRPLPRARRPTRSASSSPSPIQPVAGRPAARLAGGSRFGWLGRANRPPPDLRTAPDPAHPQSAVNVVVPIDPPTEPDALSGRCERPGFFYKGGRHAR
eukprot:scaffold2430_cov336-Prasinococcus_capsulatus_cf.AAC.4